MESKEKGTDKKFMELFSFMEPSLKEKDHLKALEKDGKYEELEKFQMKLDSKYDSMSLDDIEKIDKKIINNAAIRVADTEFLTNIKKANQLSINNTLSSILLGNQIQCNCIFPFVFQSLKVYDHMTGPNMFEVERGILGINRYYDGEYRVYNSGDTVGKGRVSMVGHGDLTFKADITTGGRYCLLMPAGYLLIRGKSRVKGQGNYTTCFDSKVWINFWSILHVNGNIIEMSGGQIHYDGTRSEDRTKYFISDRVLSPRYIFFNAQNNSYIELILRIEIKTAANEDGKAWGTIDQFGFYANTKSDYDTMVIKAV